MLTQSHEIFAVELTTGKCRQPRLEHPLEVDQLRGLLIVTHRSRYRVPALRNERPASPPPAPLEQTVLAHRLQRPAHRDLAYAKRLGDHPRVGETIPG